MFSPAFGFNCKLSARDNVVVVIVLVKVVVGICLTVSKSLVSDVELKVRSILDTCNLTCPTLDLAAVRSCIVDHFLVVEVNCSDCLEVILRPYALNFLSVADVSYDSRYIETTVVVAVIVSSLNLYILVITKGLVCEISVVIVIPEC